MTAAARQRRCRERARAGKIVLRVEVDHVNLEEQLIEAGLLRAEEADDRAALARCLEHVVKLWTQAGE
jgi:hypothetical protein